MKPLGLYIHIPFCPYRCYYCDFLIFTRKQDAIPLYLDSLHLDLQQYGKEFNHYKLISIFIGGGTPSLLSGSQIQTLLSAVKNNFKVDSNAEISMESNPGTLTSENLSGYLNAGVNRLSIGVQTTRDSQLENAGRLHTKKDCREAVQLARKTGFTNINVDLIFGLPNQVVEEWEETVLDVLQWNPEHLSMYGLQVEPATVFGAEFKQGRLQVPDEDEQAKMYETALSLLSEHGFEQYEISNFSKPGYHSHHNLIYWKNEEYLGIGVGAVSYKDKKRFWMTRHLLKYLAGEERVVGEEVLPKEKEMGETLMLGLRLKQGISAAEFKKRFDEDLWEKYGEKITKFKNLNLLEWDRQTLRLTAKGFLLANEVLQEFL